jgi:multiple sugar transport system ATP-binding protein
VFLFDEPLSNLDAQLRVTMRTEIRSLHQRLGTTMIYVTHDQLEAMTMADRIVVMHGGIIEQVGAPLELYDRPANRFVAGFIGSPAMNFLEGHIEIGDVPSFVGKHGAVLPLPPGTGQNISQGQPVLYGIRPEHLVVDRASATMAEVSVVEPTGAETQLFAKLGGHDVLSLMRERIQVRPGDLVPLAPVVEAVHLFDAATGIRIN